jgi:hypothetical protein
MYVNRCSSCQASTVQADEDKRRRWREAHETESGCIEAVEDPVERYLRGMVFCEERNQSFGEDIWPSMSGPHSSYLDRLCPGLAYDCDTVGRWFVARIAHNGNPASGITRWSGIDTKLVTGPVQKLFGTVKKVEKPVSGWRMTVSGHTKGEGIIYDDGHVPGRLGFRHCLTIARGLNLASPLSEEWRAESERIRSERRAESERMEKALGFT